MEKSTEEALLDALTLLSQESGCPDSIWHPSFGWMNLKTGEPQEVIAAFYEFLNKKRPPGF